MVDLKAENNMQIEARMFVFPYTEMDLKNLVHLQKLWLEENLTSSSVMKINDINRSMVLAMYREYGAVYLVKINLYGKPPLKKWEGEMVYNYDWDGITPTMDEELRELIQQRADTPYVDGTTDAVAVDRILNKLKEVGQLFIWSDANAAG